MNNGEPAAEGLNVDNPDEWGEFLHLPGQKFHDFSKIREEIVRDTEKHTGKNAGECHLRLERMLGRIGRRPTVESHACA